MQAISSPFAAQLPAPLEMMQEEGGGGRIGQEVWVGSGITLKRFWHNFKELLWLTKSLPPIVVASWHDQRVCDGSATMEVGTVRSKGLDVVLQPQ